MQTLRVIGGRAAERGWCYGNYCYFLSILTSAFVIFITTKYHCLLLDAVIFENFHNLIFNNRLLQKKKLFNKSVSHTHGKEMSKRRNEIDFIHYHESRTWQIISFCFQKEQAKATVNIMMNHRQRKNYSEHETKRKAIKSEWKEIII